MGIPHQNLDAHLVKKKFEKEEKALHHPLIKKRSLLICRKESGEKPGETF
jgi:hypothetical protein